MKEGERYFFVVDCLVNSTCNVNSIEVQFKFDQSSLGNADVHGSTTKNFNDLFQCGTNNPSCFCQGQTMDPRKETCTIRKQISQDRFFVTVYGYFYTEGVNLIVDAQFADSIKIYTPGKVPGIIKLMCLYIK